MNKIFEDIINEGKKTGKSIDQINKELKEAGATFHINPDYTESGWTQTEMDEGFIPAKEEEGKHLFHLHDFMGRNTEMAGKSKVFNTKEGRFEIFWDENGYAEKAIRKN